MSDTRVAHKDVLLQFDLLVCVCVSTRVCVHTWMCVNAEARGQAQELFLRYCLQEFFFFFKHSVSHWPLNCQSWLASDPQSSSGFAGRHNYTGDFTWEFCGSNSGPCVLKINTSPAGLSPWSWSFCIRTFLCFSPRVTQVQRKLALKPSFLKVHPLY